jgi:hypothetical protein
MTLQNGCVYRDKAFLWTDTAMWEVQSGRVIGHVEKAFRGTNLIWAAVYSGTFSTKDPYRVQRFIGESYPSNSRHLIEVSRQALLEQAAQGLMGRILLAFPCANEPPCLLMIASDAMMGHKPFEPYETAHHMCSGNGEPWAAEFADLDMTPRLMRRFIDHQIRTPSPTVMGWTGHSIGGNVLELEVSANGVKAKVVRTAKQVASLRAA